MPYTPFPPAPERVPRHVRLTQIREEEQAAHRRHMQDVGTIVVVILTLLFMVVGVLAINGMHTDPSITVDFVPVDVQETPPAEHGTMLPAVEDEPGYGPGHPEYTEGDPS